MLAQSYPDFEVVIVYGGHDSDFYEELVRLKQSFPQIVTTKIHLDPRFPISRKMALNVGIKSAHYECMVFTSTDAVPQTDRWLALMAKGFTRGEIVVGYCGVERRKGFANYMMRAWRMMHWPTGSPGRAAPRLPRDAPQLRLHQSLYFGANGFSHLNMNIGEDDLFMQRVMSRDNVSVILSPRLAARKMGWHGLVDEPAALFRLGVPLLSPRGEDLRPLGAGFAVLFFATVVCACGHASSQARRAAARRHPLCRRGVRVRRRAAAGRGRHYGRYFIYDLLGPLWAFLLGVLLLRRDDRVWR
ncbi:MAG: glycosyltransferase [Alistipes sp.]